LGKQVQQDYIEASKWYTEAVKQGHSAAIFNLAIMFTQGHGVTRDLNEGIKLFELATKSTDSGIAKDAKAEIARMKGLLQSGIEPNFDEQLLEKSAVAGDSKTQFQLGRKLVSQGSGAGTC
jgi:hypothetical protein